jgi:hypothetical protein
VESLTQSLQTDFDFTEALKELTQDLDSRKERGSSGQVAGHQLSNPVYQPHLSNGERLDTQGQNEILTVIPRSMVENSASGSREWNYWPQWGDAGFLGPGLRNY